MTPAVGELQVSPLFGKSLVHRIRIALRDADKALQHGSAMNRAAPRTIGKNYNAVVLPDTDLEGATKVAEATRAGVEALAIPHAEGAPIAVTTVSIGVGFADSGITASADDLLAAADAALYESKANGRNRVTARSATLQPAAEPAQA
jgi:diguanylate cyclase (GGDEF)-like protein